MEFKIILYDKGNNTIELIELLCMLSLYIKKSSKIIMITTLTEFKYFNEKKGFLLADNGLVSNLTKAQYYYVRTDEFKKWFGDWQNDSKNSSSVVDSNGEPLVVYHSSKVRFDKFDKSYQKNGWLGFGFYFSPEKKSTKAHGRYTKECFLNIRKPYYAKGDSWFDVRKNIKHEFSFDKSSSIDFNDDISSLLEDNGYTGVFYTHWDVGTMISCFSESDIDIL